MEVICDNCRIKFNRPKSQLLSKKNTFCSITCRKEYHRPDITCEGCESVFKKDPKSPLNKYCSWPCFKKSRWRIVQCAECGVNYSKRLSEIIKGEKLKSKHHCSRSCRNKYTSKLLGGNGTWVDGGKHGAAKTRGKDWRQAKLQALIRDNYECQQCYCKDKLEVHHWEPYHISYDNSLANLVTLCKECHKHKHLEYLKEGFYEDVQNSGRWN